MAVLVLKDRGGAVRKWPPFRFSLYLERSSLCHCYSWAERNNACLCVYVTDVYVGRRAPCRRGVVPVTSRLSRPHSQRCYDEPADSPSKGSLKNPRYGSTTRVSSPKLHVSRMSFKTTYANGDQLPPETRQRKVLNNIIRSLSNSIYSNWSQQPRSRCISPKLYLLLIRYPLSQ